MQDEQTPRKPIEQLLARTHSNCHYQWLLEEKFNMMRLGFLTKKQNQRLVFWVGKVSEAVRSGPVPRSELDVCLRPVGSPLPSLAIVSGWTETYEKMLSDTRFWIRAGNGSIRKVFLLRWSKTPLHEVGCDLEVYEWDKTTRKERLSQREVVLPENEDLDELQIVTVLFSEIFGKKFPDTDPNSSYIFSLGRLRAIAKKVIEEDGYGLRTVAPGPKAVVEAALAGADNSIFQELSPFSPPSRLLGQVNQLQLQLPVPPATVGTGDFEQGVPGPEQAPSTPVVNSSSLDPSSVRAGPAEPGEVGGLPAPTTLPAPSIDSPENDGDVLLRNNSGRGGMPLDGKHLDASQLPAFLSNTPARTLEGEEKPNGADPLHSPDPDLGAAPHIATSPTPDGPNKPVDAKNPGCGSPFSGPSLEPPGAAPIPSGLGHLSSEGRQTSQLGVLSPPPGGKGLPTSPLANAESPIRLERPEEDSPSKDPRDLVEKIGNPGDANTAEGKTLEQFLGKGIPSELPEDGPTPSMTDVPDHTDKRVDIEPESSPATGSDKTPASKKPEGGVPAEAHPTSGSVKRSNGISPPCRPHELESTGSASSPSGNSATPAEAEGLGEVDTEPSGLGDPGSSISIPQIESSENASNDSLPSGGRVVEQPAIDVCVTSPDDPNAETTPENINQELDATKDIPNQRVSESIADSPGKTELSLHGSKPTGVGSIDSPGLLCGGGGADIDPEPLGRVKLSASPRPLEDPHTPKAPEGTRAAGVSGSVHDFEATPKILEKWSPLLKSSQDSDVSDSSYTSGISDISDAKVNKDTDILEETDPIINPEVDSEYLEGASPSLGIDTLEALKDNDAVRGVDPVDRPKSCSEPPEKNIGSFESPPNPAQGSDLLEAASDVEPSQQNDRVNSLDANSGSLLDEGLQPIQPTDSNALEAVDGSGSIEEPDPISNPNNDIDYESPEGVNAPQALPAGIGGAGSKPSEEASSALKSPQPSDVSKVARAADSARRTDKTDTPRVGPDHPEEIVPAAASLQDSIAPVFENAVRGGASVLVDGATSTDGGPPPGDMVSPKLPPSPTTKNTSQDATPEGGSVLKDIENLETVDTLRAGSNLPEEIFPAATPLQDPIAPVFENAVRDGASVLVDGATSTSGGPPPGDTTSPKLPPSPATENTSQDAAPEGGSVLKDIENLEAVDLEGVEDIFVDTEEGFRVPRAQRREETKGSDHENLPAVELQAGGISLSDPLGLTTGDGRGISNDGTGISITAEGLENVPRTPSTASIATSLRKGDPGEPFDTCSDTSKSNPSSTEIPGFLGTRDKTMLSEPVDAPHDHQIDLLKSPKITIPSQSASAKIDENFDLSRIACKKEESTRPQSHVVAVKSDVDSQEGTQEANKAELQKMEMGSVGYFTAAVLPPTPQPDRLIPECSRCSQAAVLGRSEQGPNQYAPAGNPKSLEEEGSPQSKVDIQSNRRLSISNAISYVSSLWGKSASPTPPATPPQASNTEVHEAADTVVTPQEAAPAIKTPGSRRPAGQSERKVSWDDIVGGKKRGRSESSGSLEESLPDQPFLPPATAVGNSVAGEGPYAGDPLGIGVQFGDNVYSLMSTEVHTSGHSTSDARVIKAEANPLTRTSPASEHYEEPPSTDTADEVAQIAVANYCRQTSDETEDKEASVTSLRPRTRAVNRAVTASPIKSPFFTNLFPWSDSQRIPFATPSSARGGAPTPAIGPLGEYNNARSPVVGRTPRGGAESSCPLGQASCAHASNSIRSLGPTTTDPNALRSARCIHGGSPPTDFRPVGGRLAPLPGVSGSSVRGMQSGRYQSVIQEEGEIFAHGSVAKSDRISPERFSRLENLIKRFAQEHFSQLPPSLRVFESSASLGQSLFPPEFLCTSSLGKRLRIAAVQNIICRHLVNSIFSATVPSFCFNMEAIAGELMKLDPLKQALWQVLTVEALEALPQYEIAAAKLRQRTVNEILVSIGAISASPAATLTESLQNLVKSAQEAWEPTFKSKAQTIPEVDVENGTANFKMDPEDSLVRESFGLQAESIARPILCLFPAIYQIIDGHDILVAPGRALFSDFYHSAEMELQARLETWNSDQKYARRASFMRPPFVPHNTHPLTSPEPESGRWSTRRMSHEYFGYNQWCSHPNDFEDGAIDLWDVSRRLKECDQEVLEHERGRSAGSEPFSERRSSYVSRSRSFSSGRRESVYARKESVYERRVPVGGRRESFYGGRRESFRGSRDYCGW